MSELTVQMEQVYTQLISRSQRQIRRLTTLNAWLRLWTVATVILCSYWLLFDTGFAVLFKPQHDVMVKLLVSLPSKESRAKELLESQGYLSFWQYTQQQDLILQEYTHN